MDKLGPKVHDDNPPLDAAFMAGMKQSDRINSTSNDWEADPWDASDEIADFQIAGFQLRATQPIQSSSIRNSEAKIFGIE